MTPDNRKHIETIAWLVVALVGFVAMLAASSWRVPGLGAVGVTLFVVAFARAWLGIVSTWFERVGGARWRVPGTAAFSSPFVVGLGAWFTNWAGFPTAGARLDALAEVLVRVVGLGAFGPFAWRIVQAIQRQRRSDGRGGTGE